MHEKWATIYEMTESIPNQGTRPIQLRKMISFNSLKCLVRSSQDLDENCLEFSVSNEIFFLVGYFILCIVIAITIIVINLKKHFVNSCLEHEWFFSKGLLLRLFNFN